MNKNKKLINRIIDFILNILIVFFVIVLFFSLYVGFQIKVLKNDYANFFGYSLFETQTGSMKDTINPGDWIVVKLTKDVKIGDIITYKMGNDYITHRVVETYKGTYITKGDNNKSKDAPVDESQVVGKVKKVLNNFGIIRKTLFNKKIIILLIVVLFIFNIFLKDDKDNPKYEAKIKIFIRRLLGIESVKKPKIVDKETLKKDEPKEIKLDKPKDEEPKAEEKPIINEDKLDNTKELTKTSVYRIVKVDKDEDNERELSKTSMYSIIKADTSDLNTKVKKAPKVEESDEEEVESIVGKEVESKRVDTGRNYINYKKFKEDILTNMDEFRESLNTTKSKNILDKIIRIKEMELYQILDILNYDDFEYVKKSSLRDDYIEELIRVYYYDNNKSMKFLKEHFEEFSKKLNLKYIRNDVTLKTISILSKNTIIIGEIENKEKDNNKENRLYDNLLKKNYDWDTDYIEFVSNSIMEIQEKTRELIDSNFDKVKTDVFKMEKTKVSSLDKTYYVEVDHNINFNKIYSDYIVDKTYNEGLISEDKTAVLLSLLSIELTNDMLEHNNLNYAFILPSSLYSKEKKMETLFKSIDNPYALKHVVILVNSSDLIKYKKVTKKFKKKGYSFYSIIDNGVETIVKNLDQMYLADINLTSDEELFKKLPKDIKNKTILSEIEKLIEK